MLVYIVAPRDTKDQYGTIAVTTVQQVAQAVGLQQDIFKTGALISTQEYTAKSDRMVTLLHIRVASDDNVHCTPSSDTDTTRAGKQHAQPDQAHGCKCSAAHPWM